MSEQTNGDRVEQDLAKLAKIDSSSYLLDEDVLWLIANLKSALTDLRRMFNAMVECNRLRLAENRMTGETVKRERVATKKLKDTENRLEDAEKKLRAAKKRLGGAKALDDAVAATEAELATARAMVPTKPCPECNGQGRVGGKDCGGWSETGAECKRCAGGGVVLAT